MSRLPCAAPFLLVLLMAAPPATAQIRQVGTGYPYSTIQSAVTASATGDTIRIHPGTYSGTVTISRASLSLVAATLTNRPHLVGNILVGSQPGATIDGLEITGWSSAAAHAIDQQKGTSLTVKNCLIHDGPRDAESRAAVNSHNSTRLTVANNELYNCMKGVRIVAAYSASTGTEEERYAAGNVVRGNSIHDNPADGIDIHGEYISVIGNQIYNNADSNHLVYHPDGIQVIGAPSEGYYSVHHCIIRDNVIHNQTQNIFIEGMVSGAAPEPGRFAMDIHVFNNVIYTAPGVVNGLTFDSSLGVAHVKGEDARDIYIYNNTLGDAGNNAITFNTMPAASIWVANNIINNTWKNGVYLPASAIALLDYNLYRCQNALVISPDTHWYPTVALFRSANPSSPIERNGVDAVPGMTPFPSVMLQAGSAAINAGTVLSTRYAIDRIGQNRGAADWDIGSVEFVTRRPLSPVQGRPVP